MIGSSLASLQELLLFTVLRLHAELPTQVDEPPTIELETIRHTVQELRGMSTTRKYIRNVSSPYLLTVWMILMMGGKRNVICSLNGRRRIEEMT